MYSGPSSLGFLFDFVFESQVLGLEEIHPKETHGYRVKTLAWRADLIEARGPLTRVVSKLLSFGEVHALTMWLTEGITPL